MSIDVLSPSVGLLTPTVSSNPGCDVTVLVEISFQMLGSDSRVKQMKAITIKCF